MSKFSHCLYSSRPKDMFQTLQLGGEKQNIQGHQEREDQGVEPHTKASMGDPSGGRDFQRTGLTLLASSSPPMPRGGDRKVSWPEYLSLVSRGSTLRATPDWAVQLLPTLCTRGKVQNVP